MQVAWCAAAGWALGDRSPRQEIGNWLDTQRHNRSWWPHIFVCLDCKSIKSMASFVQGPSLEAPSLSSRCYFVFAPWLDYFKYWAIWGSALGSLGLSRKGKLVWLCDYRVCSSEGASVPAQVVWMWLPEWLLDWQTGKFPSQWLTTCQSETYID